MRQAPHRPCSRQRVNNCFTQPGAHRKRRPPVSQLAERRPGSLQAKRSCRKLPFQRDAPLVRRTVALQFTWAVAGSNSGAFFSWAPESSRVPRLCSRPSAAAEDARQTRAVHRLPLSSRRLESCRLHPIAWPSSMENSCQNLTNLAKAPSPEKAKQGVSTTPVLVWHWG